MALFPNIFPLIRIHGKIKTKDGVCVCVCVCVMSTVLFPFEKMLVMARWFSQL